MHHLSQTRVTAPRLSPPRLLALIVLLALTFTAAVAMPTLAGAQGETPSGAPLPSLPSSSVNEPPSAEPSAPTAGVIEPPGAPFVPDTDQPALPRDPSSPILLPASGEVVETGDSGQATADGALSPAVGQLPSTGTGSVGSTSSVWLLAAVPATLLLALMVLHVVRPTRVPVRRR